MSLTYEQARIARLIDAEFHRLIKLGKSPATILGEMHGHLPGFQQLMDSGAGVMREAGDRYPGFYRFAKVLECTARGINSGGISVPDTNTWQSLPREARSAQTDPIRAFRGLAAAMDFQMRQLAEEGVPTQAIISRMVVHLADLQKIWTKTTDEQLAMLCSEYPGFHHFASLMEEGAAAEAQKSSSPYDDLPELPTALKEQLEALLGTAAKLERDYQSVLNAAGSSVPPVWLAPIVKLDAQWTADLGRFTDALKSAGIPKKSQDVILPILESVARRIGELETRARTHPH